MKKQHLTFAFIVILNLCYCTKKEVKTELSAEDLAGFLDTQTGILFTTAADRGEVLSKLQAEDNAEGFFTMPILEYEGKEVRYLFQVAEVENPADYQEYIASDICMDEVFNEFGREVSQLIEGNVPNLEDRVIMACGNLAGELEKELLAQDNLEKGNEKELLEKRKKDWEKLDDFKRKLLQNGQEKGEAAQKALKEGDPEAAKKEGEELKEKAKDDYYFDLDFCKEKKWTLDLRLSYAWNPDDPLPGDLIQEFTEESIRYKVYKNASCQNGPATMASQCVALPVNIVFDTLNRPIPIPARWLTQEYYARKVCLYGNGFCVEQEVVIGIGNVYSDQQCTRLIRIDQYKGFSCFDT